MISANFSCPEKLISSIQSFHGSMVEKPLYSSTKNDIQQSHLLTTLLLSLFYLAVILDAQKTKEFLSNMAEINLQSAGTTG